MAVAQKANTDQGNRINDLDVSPGSCHTAHSLKSYSGKIPPHPSLAIIKKSISESWEDVGVYISTAIMEVPHKIKNRSII